MSQESLWEWWAGCTFLSCVLYQGREPASLGPAPSCEVGVFFLAKTSFCAPNHRGLSLGPLPTGWSRHKVPKDPETGSELSAEWKTTLHPDIHQTAALAQWA